MLKGNPGKSNKLYQFLRVVLECVCVIFPFILDVRRLDASAGVTQEEGRTGFLHLPSAVPALILIARRIQPSLSLVDREVEFCVPRNLSFSTCWACLFSSIFCFCCEGKSQFVQLHRYSNSRPNVRRSRGYQLNHRGGRLQSFVDIILETAVKECLDVSKQLLELYETNLELCPFIACGVVSSTNYSYYNLTVDMVVACLSKAYFASTRTVE